MIIPYSQAYVSTGFLDTVNDASIGSAAAPSVATLKANFLGTIVQCDNNNVRGSVTLYGGYYQYVLTKSGSTAAPARGTLCFWDTLANGGNTKYVVTPDATSTNITQVAGVYLGAPTKGNYCYVQIGGLATVKYIATVTDTGIGDVVFVDVTPTNTCDANTEASATARQQTKRVGIAYAAPANAGLSQVWLGMGAGAMCLNI